MGELADMMINGLLCQHCGVLMDDEEEPGYPRDCPDCAREERKIKKIKYKKGSLPASPLINLNNLSQEKYNMNDLETQEQTALIKPADMPDFQKLATEIEAAVKESVEIVVLTGEDVEKASLFVSKFKDLEKRIDEVRLSITKPYREYTDEVNAGFKSLAALFAKENKRLSGDLLTYKRKQQEKAEREAKEEKERLEKEAKEKAEAAKAAGEEVNPEDVIVPDVVAKQVKLSDKNSSGVGTRKVKMWRITDPNLIPRQYFILDEKTVNAIRQKAGADDQSTIPGIEFYSEEAIRR